MNAQFKNTHICTDCQQMCVGSKSFLPNGWGIIDRDDGKALLCNDCIGIGYFIKELERPKTANINAVAMPVQKSVAVFFDDGRINLSLEESEAIVAALSEANTLLRGQHNTQKA